MARSSSVSGVLKLRDALPFVALAMGTAGCIFLSVFFTTGFGPDTKLEQILLQFFLVAPPAIWVLRQRSARPEERTPRPVPILPFFLLFIIGVIPVAWRVRNGIYNADESAYLFQARIFRSLKTAASAPPDSVRRPEFNFQNHIIFHNQWFGKYPPGWPALLAALSFVLPVWVAAPALGALLLWTTYAIAKCLYDQRTASVAAALMACSPYFLLMCVGYMSHVACGLFLAVATLCLIRASQTEKIGYFALAFGAFACALLIRQFTTACMATVLLCAAFWSARRNPVLIGKAVMIGMAIAGVSVAIILCDNHVLTGHYWRSPYALYGNAKLPPELNFSFRNLIWNARTITPVSIAKTMLYGFPFVAPLALYAVYRERSRQSILLFGLVASLVAGYLGMTTVSDSLVGERFYFEAYFAIAILAARGWDQLQRSWQTSQLAQRSVIVATALLAAYYYGNLRRISIFYREPYAQVFQATEHLHSAPEFIVFMQPGSAFKPENYNANSADWQHAHVVFAIDPGEDKRDAAACILGRPFWVVESYDAERKHVIVENPAEPINCADSFDSHSQFGLPLSNFKK